MQKYDLTHHLFPLTAMWLNNDPDGVRSAYIEQALRNTDERVANDKPITPMFLFAVLLWGPVSGSARQLYMNARADVGVCSRWLRRAPS